MFKKILRLTKEALFAAYFYKNPITYYKDRLRLFPNRTIHLVLRNGIRYAIHSNTRDTCIVDELWNRKIYDRLISYIKDGSNVIDIGAQAGIFSVKAARHAFGVKAWSYEPMASNFELLKENISINNLQNAITPINSAVGGRAEPLVLFVHEGDSGGASIHPHGDRALMRSVTVPSVTLADIFSKNKIDRCDFLKVDCEGAELDIMRKAPKEIFTRIQSITLEWHDDHNRAMCSLDDFRKFLGSQGYQTDFDILTGTLFAWR